MSQNYTPTKWIDDKTVGTASVMNNMEKGIKDAHDRIDEIDSQFKETYNENVISILNFNSIKEAIAYAKENNKIIDLNGKNISYNLNENLIVDSVEIRNGFIEILSNSKIILKGNNPILRNIKIKMHNDSVGGLNNGVIELITSSNAVIDNVYANVGVKWSFLFCKTRAYNTQIRNLKLEGNLRYGILFNDACSEQGESFRILDGVDYSDGTIGAGLIIDNYEYINTVSDDNTIYDGDGIEINCPDYGFDNIMINNVKISRARHVNGASGMALGFAKCRNIIIDNVKIENCGFDGLHFENKCQDVYVNNFRVDECVRGISIGSCKNVVLTNGNVNNCTVWLSMSNLHDNNKEINFENITFKDNKILNENFYSKISGFEINDMKNSTFRNVKCINNGKIGYGFLNLGLSKYLTSSNTNINGYIDVQSCTFENFTIEAGNHTLTSPKKIIELGENSKSNIFNNIKIYGYNSDNLLDFNSLDLNKNDFQRYIVDDEFVKLTDIILVNLLNFNNYVNYNISADGTVNSSAENYAYKISIENGKRYGLYRVDGNGNIIKWSPRVAITDDTDITLESYISTTNDITINNENAKYMYIWNPGFTLSNYSDYQCMVLKNFNGNAPIKYLKPQE